MGDNGTEKERIMIEKFIRHDRFYVRLSVPLSGRSTWPQANYNWLMGNPAFKDIPKGYVIHHLDGDKQNDDITNLALMQKYHHMSHHWKQKTNLPEVNLNFEASDIKRTFYFPLSEPNIYQRKGGNFFLYFVEKIDGERKQIKIYSWNGEPFLTREIAERVKNIIWPKQPES